MIKKSRKIIYCVLSLLLIFTLLCSFRFASDDIKPTQHWDYTQIKEHAKSFGYQVEKDPETGLDVYKSILGISYLSLPHDGSDFDIVVVKLSSPITVENEDEEDDKYSQEPNEPRLYYNLEADGRFVNGNYCDSVNVDAGSTMNAETTLVFKTAFPEEKNAIALNIDGEFSIDSVSVYETTGKTATLKFNPISFACFALILILSALLERKLGFFSFISSKVKNEISRIKELKASDNRHFAVHLSSLISTLVLTVSVVVLVMLARFTKVTIAAVFVIGTVAVILQLIDKIRFEHGTTNAARLFLTVALLVGVTFCYTSPVTTHASWDDEAHFSNSYMAAVMGNNDQSLAEAKLFSYQYSVEDYLSNPNHFIRLMAEESEIHTEYEHSFGNVYTHISYLPMILVIALSKLLSADMIKILVLCKFANMLAFAFIAYTGIKKLKSGALIFSAVCLLPCVLFLSCSIGYDFWLIGWMVYCFAYIISLIQQPDRKITPVDCAKILLAFFVGCSAKALYCVLMLPLMFINKEKFQKPSHAKIFRLLTVLTVILIIAILVLPGIFSFNFYADSRGGEDIDPIAQFIYVISHPVEFAHTLFMHISDLCSLKRFNIYSATYGYLDGHNGSNQLLYGTVALIILLYCIIVDRKEDDNYECSLMQKTRWITHITCFLQVVVICGAMYAAFNNVGSTSLYGTQFRYLFPMLAPFAFFLTPKRVRCSTSLQSSYAFIFGGITLNLLVGYLTTYLWKVLVY